MLIESYSWDTTISHTSIQDKPDNLSSTHPHLNLFLNSVHKYTDIYVGIELLALKGVMVLDRGATPYPFLYLSFLNCVHKYTDVYDAVGMLGLVKGQFVL